MPFAYAFKNAATAAERESGLSKLFSLEIARVTGGEFSHVECWIDGPINAAVCYSSREPTGTGIQVVDLSDPALWAIVPIPTTPAQDGLILGYARGCSGRKYNMAGIVGIGTSDPKINDWTERFCSQTSYDVTAQNIGLFDKSYPSVLIAPSGPTWRGPFGTRYGLYELATGKETIR